MAYPARNQNTEAFWRRVIGRQAQSGLTAKEFCEREGLSAGSFYCWKHTLRLRDQATDRPAMKAASADRDRKSRSPRTKAAAKNPPRNNGRTRATAGNTFVSVELVPEPGQALEIVHPRGHIVRVPSCCPAVLLREVLALLDVAQVSAD